MKVRVTFEGEYELSDDPKVRMSSYQTTDDDECMAVDALNVPEDLLGLMDDFRIVSIAKA